MKKLFLLIVKKRCCLLCFFMLFTLVAVGKNKYSNTITFPISMNRAIPAIDASLLYTPPPPEVLDPYLELRTAISRFETSTGCKLQIFSYLENNDSSKLSVEVLIKKIVLADPLMQPVSDCMVTVNAVWSEENEKYKLKLEGIPNDIALTTFADDRLQAFSDTLSAYTEEIAAINLTSADKGIIEALYALHDSSTSTIRKTSKENFLKGTQLATEVGEKTNPNGSACNVCVRSALLLLKSDTALFPITGNLFYDPYNSYIGVYKKGHISSDGRAANIKADFDNIANRAPLKERFVEQKKSTQDSWSDYFKKLQNEADRGHIIIGVMLCNDNVSGHVVMITPGGLVDISRKEDEIPETRWGDSYTTQGINKVPRILECGKGVRENEAPLCRNIDRKGAQNRIKWFKYVK
jgi:hypothetical protein